MPFTSAKTSPPLGCSSQAVAQFIVVSYTGAVDGIAGLWGGVETLPEWRKSRQYCSALPCSPVISNCQKTILKCFKLRSSGCDSANTAARVVPSGLSVADIVDQRLWL